MPGTADFAPIWAILTFMHVLNAHIIRQIRKRPSFGFRFSADVHLYGFPAPSQSRSFLPLSFVFRIHFSHLDILSHSFFAHRPKVLPFHTAFHTAFIPMPTSTPPKIWRIMGVVAVRILRTPARRLIGQIAS